MTAARPVPGGARRALALLRRHLGLVALLVVAGALRTAVVQAYSTALWFPDSGVYYSATLAGRPPIDRPFGYPAFLRVVDGVLDFHGVAVLQHVLGLVTIVVVYALLQRRGVSRRVSLLAVLPLALDAYVLDIEHFILAESLFLLLLAVTVAVLLWRARPGPVTVTAVGLLVGALTLTRAVGTFVAALLLVYLVVRVLLRSLRWTVLVGYVAGAAVVLVPYAAWFDSAHGSFALSSYTGHFLYGRVSNFVECDRVDVPERLRPLCPAPPVAQRPDGDYYVWTTASPANVVSGGRPVFSDQDIKAFSTAAIKAQPLDYARLVLHDTLHYALPGRGTGPRDVCAKWWEFPVPPTIPPKTCIPVLAPTMTPEVGSDLRATLCRPEHDCPPGLVFAWHFPAPRHDPGLVRALQRYQDVAYTPGPVLALCALAGLAAPLLRRRSRGQDASRQDARGPDEVRGRLDPVLLAGLGVLLVAAPSATSSFDFRYLLPTLVVLPPAAALAALRLRARPAPRKDAAPA